jgi:hypothetical protein
LPNFTQNWPVFGIANARFAATLPRSFTTVPLP